MSGGRREPSHLDSLDDVLVVAAGVDGNDADVVLDSGVPELRLQQFVDLEDAGGVDQVDELLNAKLRDSRIEDHVRIVAVNARSDDENIVERIEM